MIAVRKLDTTNPKDIQTWIQLPYRLYANQLLWAPQLVSDAKFQLDREKNPFYTFGDAAFFLAEKEGRAAGRIAVLDNQRLNELRDERHAFFYLFETENDFKIAEALFDAASKWGAERGLEALVGPKGFLTIDSVGMLAQGFERFPAMGMAWNPPFYIDFMERMGFEKVTDYTTGWLQSGFVLPEKIFRIAEKAQKRYGYHTQIFKSKKEIEPIAEKVIETYNQSFVENWEHVPISDAEFPVLLHRILSILNDPTLPRVVWKEDQVVGFILAYPDVNRAIKRANGKLWPFGWWHLLRGMKRTDWIDINGAGILPQYQGRGVDAIMMAELWHVLNDGKKQYRLAEICQVNEANDKMQKEMATVGVSFDKRHRIFRRRISPTPSDS